MNRDLLQSEVKQLYSKLLLRSYIRNNFSGKKKSQYCVFLCNVHRGTRAALAFVTSNPKPFGLDCQLKPAQLFLRQAHWPWPWWVYDLRVQIFQIFHRQFWRFLWKLVKKSMLCFQDLEVLRLINHISFNFTMLLGRSFDVHAASLTWQKTLFVWRLIR